jgi:hypothetical protein
MCAIKRYRFGLAVVIEAMSHFSNCHTFGRILLPAFSNLLANWDVFIGYIPT